MIFNFFLNYCALDENSLSIEGVKHSGLGGRLLIYIGKAIVVVASLGSCKRKGYV